MDYTILIGGEAGQGLQTVGAALARVLSRQGYHVFTHQDYMSRIRGGHNFYQIRVSEKPLCASTDQIHILVALDRDTIIIHQDALLEHGIILHDPQAAAEEFSGDRFMATPFVRLAEESGGGKIMANSVAIGAVLGLFGLSPEIMREVLADFLSKKNEEILNQNLLAVKAGHDHSRRHCTRLQHFAVRQSAGKKLMLINGTQAVAAGALMSGCKFYAAYPMTPSTGIMVYLAGKSAEFNIVVEQAEDEISAINMALGASYAGVRAMTGTSGGGFALMTEGLSRAGMTETPLVIMEGQRPGPATGLPTRTEQGDLSFVIHGGHGEFPRVVLTPGSPEQAFFAANKAFDLAEKYQIPVFILTDQYLADTEWTYEGLDPEKLIYEDYRLRGGSLRGLAEYKRYAFTDSGISPLAVPGDSTHLVVVDSDEHDEEGHIIEDAATRVKMVHKRLFAKRAGLRAEIALPVWHGDQEARMVLLGFGSTLGVMREVVDELAGSSPIAMLHFSEVYPFPALEEHGLLDRLRKAEQTICIENNATGQFERLLRAETGFCCTGRINRYDGRPFTLESLVQQVRAQMARM
ncbi:MAG: 2-oxoacid:acceptor oxidoreductase subunit alpha [Deltaproteobacteria bacterium]|nr:2-oxoacid:acceptor oxidoreductase subunit alpha [Deltaproteobacteria bacterium]